MKYFYDEPAIYNENIVFILEIWYHWFYVNVVDDIIKRRAYNWANCKKVEFLTNRVYNEYNKTILYLLVGQYARNNNEKAL